MIKYLILRFRCWLNDVCYLHQQVLDSNAYGDTWCHLCEADAVRRFKAKKAHLIQAAKEMQSR